MTNLLIAFFAYFLDKRYGEFRFIRHPVIFIGDLITFFEKRFYKDSIVRGGFLVLFVLSSVSFVLLVLLSLFQSLPFILNITLNSLFASMFIAHKMLRDSVENILNTEDKKGAISMLVSRDTQDMSESDIYKAAIETYGENLSDGVVAPLFYLLFFGVFGIVIYKSINTLDSMIGYRNKRYEKFGKIAARLDDIANYIPSRLTALLIMFFGKKRNLWSFYKDGKKHESPNAGHPITAMALVLGVSLGGDTSYFGSIKKKAYFGVGRKNIVKNDVKNALKIL